MDEATATLIVGLAVAVLGAVIQYMKKNQGFRQTDTMLKAFEVTLGVFDTLAAKYPGIEKDVGYLHVIYDNMNAAWNDSRVTDSQVNAIVDSFKKLVVDINAEVAKIAK